MLHQKQEIWLNNDVIWPERCELQEEDEMRMEEPVSDEAAMMEPEPDPGPDPDSGPSSTSNATYAAKWARPPLKAFDRREKAIAFQVNSHVMK